jgi:hypothetical protein
MVFFSLLLPEFIKNQKNKPLGSEKAHPTAAERRGIILIKIKD